jgi:hypothetical protein
MAFDAMVSSRTSRRVFEALSKLVHRGHPQIVAYCLDVRQNHLAYKI